MERVTSVEQFEQKIQGDKPVVMKFDATWCSDCKNLSRFIGDVIANHTDKDFYEIDADEFMPIAEKYDVRGIPSLLVFKNGEKVAHLHSKLAKTPAQIEEYLSQV